MLEENLRELQVSSADALASEQRRSKDLIARLEREKVALMTKEYHHNCQ